jgi:translocation and assembly module TamB
MMRKIFFILWLILLPLSASAQEEDKGFLTEMLESSLGGEGRTVSINGFAGAFSSRATINSITIADTQGIWLTLEDVVVDWNRSALLRGRVDVQELSATRIDLPRLPVAPETELPPAEAGGFALPDLPVSITVGQLRADEITLGAPVLGQAAALTLEASGTLAGGMADVALNAERTDGQRGLFELEGSFENDVVTLQLQLDEGEAGIAARLLQLPGLPPVTLRVASNGPLDAFSTELTLATDGAERLAGTVTLQSAATSGPGPSAARRFAVDIGGDVTALFAPQYRPFFGEEVALRAEGMQGADGALTLDALDLQTEALNLSGSAALNSDNWPTRLDITGRVAHADGEPVLLPLSGAETTVREAQLQVAFDADDGDRWSAAFEVAGLARPDVAISQTRLTANGTLQGKVNAIGAVSAVLDLVAEGIALPDDGLQQAVGSRIDGALTIDFTEGQPLRLSGLDLAGEDYALTGEAVLSGLEDALNTGFDLMVSARDLSRFSAISGQALQGEAKLALEGEADAGGSFDVNVAGDVTGLSTGIAQADAMLAGRTTLALAATRDTEGTRIRGLDLRNPQLSLTGQAQLATESSDVQFNAMLNEAGLVLDTLEGPLTVDGRALQDAQGWRVDVDAAGPYQATAALEGLATGPDAALTFDIDIPDIAPVVPGYSGAVELDGRVDQSPDGWLVETVLAGPYGLDADVAGRVTGQNAPDVRFVASLPDVKPFAPQFTGAVRVTGTAVQRGETLTLDTELSGPYGLDATVGADMTGADITARYDARLPNMRPLAPQFNGPLAVTGTALRRGEVISVETDLDGPYGLTANVAGDVAGPAPAITLSANLPNVAPLVPGFSGPLNVNGTARQDGQNWFIDTAVGGPAGTTADIVGRVGTDSTLGLSVAGSAPLALANPFIAPRNIQGQTQFDLRIEGPPALGSVSGRITATDGRLTAPNLRVALTDIGAQIGLSGGRADLALQAAVSSGGTLAVRGPITLTGDIPAELGIDLSNVTITDPALYETLLDGRVTVIGPLTGGARIAGRIDVGPTTVSVPSSGLGGFTIVPQIAHIGASQAVRATQSRAGLDEKTEAADNGGGGRPYPLDLLISAPSRIFVRGRGLDAELGGQLQLTGTTDNIISSGRFELIRGRLDILEKRFQLDEGSVQLQGNFDPFLRFVATTPTSAGSASVIIEGPASAPEVTFSSTPEAPQDEVLAQIFFGRDVSQLSAFQALQLANAVATLAGNGGEGIVSRLRRGFDLDDLDVTTDTEGNTAVRAGKYLSDNVYTDVEVGGADGAEVSINVDLTPSITARGSATASGETAIGIFFERDY